MGMMCPNALLLDLFSLFDCLQRQVRLDASLMSRASFMRRYHVCIHIYMSTRPLAYLNVRHLLKIGLPKKAPLHSAVFLLSWLSKCCMLSIRVHRPASPCLSAFLPAGWPLPVLEGHCHGGPNQTKQDAVLRSMS